MRIGLQILVVLGVLLLVAKVAAAQGASMTIPAGTYVAAAADGIIVGPARRYVYRPVPYRYDYYWTAPYTTYRPYDYWYEPPRYYDYYYRDVPYRSYYYNPGWYYGPRRSIIIGY